MKKSFILHADLLNKVSVLNDEQMGKLFRAILIYSNTGEVIEMDQVVEMAFMFVKGSLDHNSEMYERRCKSIAEARERRKQKSQIDINMESDRNHTDINMKSIRYQTDINSDTDTDTDTDTVTDTDTDTDTDKDKRIKRESKKRESRFQRPTLPQIQDYVFEKALNVDPERFFDYYESNGWRVGRNPMKDWKAALRNWSSKDSKKNTNTTFAAIDELLREEGYDGAKGMV
jgi:hypothetical protein